MNWTQMNEYVSKNFGNMPLETLEVDEDFTIVENLYKILPKWCIVAGGAIHDTIRDTKFKDLDLFILSDEKQFFERYSSVCRILSNYSSMCKQNLKYTEYRVDLETISIPVQIIKRVFVDISEILNSFDLTPCRVALDRVGQVWCTPDFKLYHTTGEFVLNLDCATTSLPYRVSRYASKCCILLPEKVITEKVIPEKADIAAQLSRLGFQNTVVPQSNFRSNEYFSYIHIEGNKILSAAAKFVFEYNEQNHGTALQKLLEGRFSALTFIDGKLDIDYKKPENLVALMVHFKIPSITVYEEKRKEILQLELEAYQYINTHRLPTQPFMGGKRVDGRVFFEDL